MKIEGMMPSLGAHRSFALEIQSSWTKLGESDVDDVKTTSELAAQVARVYGVSMPKALHDVQAWAQGRRF